MLLNEVRNYSIYVQSSGVSSYGGRIVLDADGWILGPVNDQGWRHDLKAYPSGATASRWVHVEPEPRIGYNTHAE